jgi:hypothetical protein
MLLADLLLLHLNGFFLVSAEGCLILWIVLIERRLDYKSNQAGLNVVFILHISIEQTPITMFTPVSFGEVLTKPGL